MYTFKCINTFSTDSLILFLCGVCGWVCTCSYITLCYTHWFFFNYHYSINIKGYQWKALKGQERLENKGQNTTPTTANDQSTNQTAAKRRYPIECNSTIQTHSHTSVTLILEREQCKNRLVRTVCVACEKPVPLFHLTSLLNRGLNGESETGSKI